MSETDLYPGRTAAGFVYAGAVILVLASLTGCAKDRSLEPPADSERIDITVKLPENLALKTLEVMYRSPVCKRITHGASGQRIELDGYHGLEVQLVREGQTDLYSASLPKDGGGACQWHLANATIGVNFTTPQEFGKNIDYWAGATITAVFDKNRPSRTSNYPQKVEGDVIQKTDYYPWVIENSIDGPTKGIVMLGRAGDHVNYMAPNAKKVYFEPVLHSGFVARSIGPTVKKKGNYKTVFYPDGSVEPNTPYKPEFVTLEAIRLRAEGSR